MRVAHRLYLTVGPAMLGVLVVAALAYWGQYARSVPQVILVVAAVAAVGTLALTWLNARYVAQRVERLAGAESAGGGASVSLRGIASAVAPGHIVAGADELDTIESAVDRLRDYATLMATVAGDLATRLEEVRLPLHILLENHFGELNENQEEMLGTARAAADAADADVVAMRQLADLDRGARTLRRDRMLPGDLVRALVPTLQAHAETRGVTLRVEIEPLAPAIWGDRPQLQEALAVLLGDAIASAEQNELTLSLEKREAGCRILVSGAGVGSKTVRRALAMRLVAAMGGRVEGKPGELSIVLESSVA